MTETEASGVGEAPPPYMIFLVVFFFFLTGLLGFLVCHMLKKKGYRCRTGDMDDEDEQDEDSLRDEEEENQDTVEKILKCIIENEANMEAFNEMLGNRNVCVRHDPRLRKESLGGLPPHHHTVHSGADPSSCHLCAQIRSKKGRRQSRTPRSKLRPGEQTVLSVGRFRVTHTDKKLHGGPNPLVASRNQLDQSQDSEEQKDASYNLRNMFKEGQPPLESSGGTPQNVGKRKKSVTLFGLRRSSDPATVKAGEPAIKETGGGTLTSRQQPVVQEEPTQKDAQRGSELVESQPTNPKTSATASQSHQLVHPETGAALETATRFQTEAVRGVSSTSVPTSLPIPSPSSQHTLKKSPRTQDVDNQMLNCEEPYDPGPLQTSTPIIPGPLQTPAAPGPPQTPAGAGVNAVISPCQTEASMSKVLPVAHEGPNLDPGIGAGPGLKILASPLQPSPAALSPKLSSDDAPSKAASTPASSPGPSGVLGGSGVFRHPSSSADESDRQSPKPPPAVGVSPQSGSMPSSFPYVSSSFGGSADVSVASGATAPTTPETTAHTPPLLEEEDAEPERKTKSDGKLLKDKASSLLLSPGGPPSPTGPPSGPPTGPPLPQAPSGSSSSATSPDGKRSFSVLTVLEEEKKSTSETTPARPSD